MSVLRLMPVIGDDVEIDRDRVLVGREPTCDVVVEHGSVSRKHAVLERRGTSWFVVDQGSANGTFLDSARVSEAPLRHGQELRFGAATFRVDIRAERDLGGGATLLTPAAEATVVHPAPAGPPPGGPPPRPPARPAAPPGPGAPAPPPAAPGRPPGAPAPRAGAPAPAGPPPLPPRASVPPPPPGAPGRPPRPAAGAPAEGAAPPRKGKGPLFWGLAGCSGCLLMVLLFVGLIAGGAYFMTSAATSEVRAQLADVKAGRLDAAYGRLSEECRGRVSRQEFAAFVGRHPALRDNADSSFWSRSVHNDRADISGTLKAGSGASEKAAFRLVKQGGGWKVDSMEVEGDRPGARRSARSPGAVSLSAQLDKARQGDLVRVVIRAEAAGFAVRPDGGQYAFELMEDVETTGPDGQKVAELSAEAVQRHEGRTSLEEGAVYPFQRVLTLDPNIAPGTYSVRLTLRDVVGGGRTSRDLSFDMP